MFTNYIIKDRILYLNIDINYEFGDDNRNNKNILDNIKEYISKINIKNKFNKIVITCSGVIIGTILFLNNNKIENDNIRYVPSLKNDISFIYNNEEKEESLVKNNNEITNIENNVNENVQNNVSKSDNTSENIVNNDIQSSHTYVEEDSQSSVTNPSVSNQTMITVRRSNGSIIDIELEEYIIGVIAAEMPASFNVEALKAQAVVARTYALKAKAESRVLTDTISTQAYIDQNEMRNKWGSSFDTYYNKIKNAVENTSGEYLTYNGAYIEALYHSTNNGKTESSLDVFGNYYPYLISVSSEYDKSASSYLRDVNYDINFVSSKLGTTLNNDSIIEIISYTDGGNIKEINVNGKTFTGRQFRELLGLRSADFDININGDNVNITTRGFGHGVGMSQYGANGMANAGYNYQSILSHYYPSTTLKK